MKPFKIPNCSFIESGYEDSCTPSLRSLQVLMVRETTGMLWWKKERHGYAVAEEVKFNVNVWGGVDAQWYRWEILEIHESCLKALDRKDELLEVRKSL